MVREFCTFIVTTIEIDDEAGAVAIGSSAVEPAIPDGGRESEPLRLSAARWAEVFAVIERQALAEYGSGDNVV